MNAAITLSFLVAGLLAGSAGGQDWKTPYAARLPTRHLSPENMARLVTNRYAGCLVKFKPTAVERALAQPIGKSEIAVARLATAECLSDGELRMPPTLLRGALYRAMYLRDFAETAPKAQGRVDYEQDSVPGSDYASLQIFASCVERRDSAASRQLIMAEVGGVEENLALGALQPHFAACISPERQIKFSRTVLQSVFSEVAYREARAGNVTLPTAGKN